MLRVGDEGGIDSFDRGCVRRLLALLVLLRGLVEGTLVVSDRLRDDLVRAQSRLRDGEGGNGYLNLKERWKVSAGQGINEGEARVGHTSLVTDSPLSFSTGTPASMRVPSPLIDLAVSS